VTRLTITIHPVPPPSTAPNGTIDGNVYRVTATTNTGAAVGVRKNKAEIDLRGTGLRGSPVIEQFNQGRWSRLTTGQFIGVAMYTANISGLGDFALVFAGKATAGGNSSLPYVIIGAAVVVLLLVGLLLARVARGPSTEENSAR
jgi:hypothetical protein